MSKSEWGQEGRLRHRWGGRKCTGQVAWHQIAEALDAQPGACPSSRTAAGCRGPFLTAVAQLSTSGAPWDTQQCLGHWLSQLGMPLAPCGRGAILPSTLQCSIV